MYVKYFFFILNLGNLVQMQKIFRETVDMFHYLTEGVQEPFMKPELADRLAAMLGTTY